MDFTPSPLQTLVLFRLVFTGDEPKLSELKQLAKKPRQELVNAGFIELEKRGRPQHIVLTDKAWEWVSNHLDAPISRRASTTEAFAGLLSQVNRFLRNKEMALAEFFAESASDKTTPADIHTRIQSAYLRLSGGQSNVRVRLKDLREALADISDLELNRVLLDLQRRGKLVLMHLDDPQERTPADEAAAIDILGHKRHIVYMEKY